MVKLYCIPGTDVKIRISQDDDLWVRVGFEGDSAFDHLLSPKYAPSIAVMQALGFSATKPQPIDGGDLEEVTE